MSYSIFKKIKLVNFEVQPHENIGLIETKQPKGYTLNKFKQFINPSDKQYSKKNGKFYGSLVRNLPQDNLPPYEQNLKFVQSHGTVFESDWELDRNIDIICPVEAKEVINIRKIETEESKIKKEIRKKLENSDPNKVFIDSERESEYIFIKEIINFK